MTGDHGDAALPVALPVALGTITAGECRIEYAVSCYHALTQGAAMYWVPQACGPYLDMGRNDTVRKFYDQCPDAEFLLFVDSDIQFTPDDVRRLVAAARDIHDASGVWPVVGGLYLSPFRGSLKAVAYRLESKEADEGKKRFYPLMLDDIPDATNALLEVEGLGTGFMLIHRDILDHFQSVFPGPQEWFYEGVINDVGSGEWVGEDLFFCLRAASLGHPVLAHAGVRLTHYKTQGFSFPAPTPEEAP